MRQLLIVTIVVLGCDVEQGDDDLGDPEDLDAVSSELDTDKPIHVLTGDGTTIRSDWKAVEAGDPYVHPVVDDGSPSKPWISTAHYVGSKSIAFQVPTDLSGARQRFEYKIAQAADSSGLHFDNARYSGFVFKIGGTAAPFLSSALIWQAHQGAPYSPPVQLSIRGSSPPFQLRMAVHNMATGSGDKDIEVFSENIIQPNTWYRVQVYVKPRYNSEGTLKLWINGVRRLEWTGSIGYDPSKYSGSHKGLDIKNGIYQPHANNGHLFYFDQIKFGSTFVSVQP